MDFSVTEVDFWLRIQECCSSLQQWFTIKILPLPTFEKGGVLPLHNAPTKHSITLL